MKIIIRIAGLMLIALLLGAGCKNEKNEVVPVDSSQIFPSGSVIRFVFESNVFVDTGAVVTIKGKGFDVNMKNRYFLIARNEDTKQPNNSLAMSEQYKSTEEVRDSNLVYIDDSTLIFKLPKYSLVYSNRDSAYLYFMGLKGRDIYLRNDGTKSIHATIMSRTQLTNTPIYRLLMDTLYLSKKYDSRNKQIIQGNYSSETIKVVIQNLEYKSVDGYFVKSVDYNAPLPLMTTLSMVATQDLFYLPDGSYSFEIYERGGSQRKFVEERGKTKIYIKNIP